MSKLKYLQLNPVHNCFKDCPMVYEVKPYLDTLYSEIRWYRILVPLKLTINKKLLEHGDKKESYMDLLK